MIITSNVHNKKYLQAMMKSGSEIREVEYREVCVLLTLKNNTIEFEIKGYYPLISIEATPYFEISVRPSVRKERYWKNLIFIVKIHYINEDSQFTS